VTASSSPKPTPRPAKPDTSAAAPSLTKAPTTPDAAPNRATAQPAAKTDATARPNGRRAAAEASIGELVSDASTHLSNLIHSEIELAKLELRSTVKNAGTGAGLFAAAAVVLVFSLTFGFFALAEGIAALGLDRWLAFLLVFVLQLAAVGLFVFIGIRKVKRVHAPEQTIKTTKETVDYLKKSRG
jgi:hypothetical protein